MPTDGDTAEGMPTPNDHPPDPLDAVDFADELDTLLMRIRGLCEVVKWTKPEQLNEPTQPLLNSMQVVTDLLDEAKALADRWYNSKRPSASR